MRRVTALLSVVAMVLMGAGVVAQAKPSFAGEWKKVATDGQGEPGVDLIITQAAGATTVEDVRRRQVSTAQWAGNTLVVTTTTSAGAEKRTFSMDGASLVVATSTPSRGGGAPTVTTVAYQRYQRGFGG